MIDWLLTVSSPVYYRWPYRYNSALFTIIGLAFLSSIEHLFFWRYGLDRALEFVGNHPFLFGILAVLAILFFTIENKRSGRKISPNTLGMMVNSQNAQLIDIRAKKKFESGYIQGSRNIPFTDLKERLAEIRAIEQPVIIICDMGVQAGAAIQMIGKDSVYRLEGGIGGWQGAGMPLVGVKDAKSKNKAKTKPSLSK